LALLYSVGLAAQAWPASSSHRASIGGEELSETKDLHEDFVKVSLDEFSQGDLIVMAVKPADGLGPVGEVEQPLGLLFM
jgi:hypothetical protein